MTTLEGRCRFLLHLYPAAYRRDREDEMIGTLLQTTPPGRTWCAAAAANWWVTSPDWWGQSWKWLTAVLVLAVLALQRVRRQAVL